MLTITAEYDNPALRYDLQASSHTECQERDKQSVQVMDQKKGSLLQLRLNSTRQIPCLQKVHGITFEFNL